MRTRQLAVTVVVSFGLHLAAGCWLSCSSRGNGEGEQGRAANLEALRVGVPLDKVLDVFMRQERLEYRARMLRRYGDAP